MLVIENQVVCQHEIIDIRTVAQHKIQTKEGRKLEIEQIESKIKQQIAEKIGMGWFMSQAAKDQIEKEVNESYKDAKQKINNKYDL